jgi:hypothetical protein
MKYIVSPHEEPVKRKRGRPRKHPIVDVALFPKRKRGRPRKHPLPDPAEQVNVPKRKRGRPRKQPVSETSSTNIAANINYINTEIRKTFNKYGCKFRLLKTRNNWCIYERRSSAKDDRPQYEVVRYYKHPTQHTMHYPGSSMWGIYGFTYNDLQRAEQQFADKSKKKVKEPS